MAQHDNRPKCDCKVKCHHCNPIHNSDELDSKFFDLLNTPRDWTKEDRMSPQFYGSYEAEQGLRWDSNYAKFGIDGQFRHEVGDREPDAPVDDPPNSGTEVIGVTRWATDSVVHATNNFHLTYDIFYPRGCRDKKLLTIVLVHGVPVNRREWYLTAKLLARFCRVITVDLLGMGDSSKPLSFKDGDTDLWSWGLHSKIFNCFVDEVVGRKCPVYFGANDWGAGMLQKLMELHGSGKVKWCFIGAIPGSMIALNGYWVQHIGSLQALNFIPYFDPADPNKIFFSFLAESIRFAGVLTTLLETMFYKTEAGLLQHNQYSMAQIQDPYVQVRAYDDVKRNPQRTVYRAHSIRVLAEQASVILGNGELLPFHPEKNPNGLKFTKWNLPISMLWGKWDKMMPEGQVHRFSNMVALINQERHHCRLKTRLSLEYRVIKEAGHFAATDQPEETADAILQFITNTGCARYLKFAFMGFDSIARGDEALVIAGFTDMFSTV